MSLYETGSRWKYDRPGMFANKAIRPPRGAALIRYDPWEAFHALQGKYRTAETLWGQFIELVRRCRQDALDRYTPSARGGRLRLWTG
jgi:hypothetical protein